MTDTATASTTTSTTTTTTLKSIPPLGSLTDIHPNAQWIKNGRTVAGQNPSLKYPYGLYVDDDLTIYVADWGNSRIVAWKSGEINGQVVVGEHGPGNGANQLDHPTDVMVDKEEDSLIICDATNKRVVRWSRQNGTSGETIISNIGCHGLTMDENRFLYVSDKDKHEVRRYRLGESYGTVVAGGNGRGSGLNQLYDPSYIVVDRDLSVFVSDVTNNRVMKWTKGATKGILVAGGNGQGDRLHQLVFPKGIQVDSLNNVYVVDGWNHRIVRWYKGKYAGDIIAAGNGQGAREDQLYAPIGLSFGRYGNIYVADYGNDRVQRFTIKIPSN